MNQSLSLAQLGRDGPRLSRVGFGSWVTGGGGWAFGWGPQDDELSIRAMRRAVDLGVNWIDTAAVYGLGHAEEVVGKFLRDLPPASRPYVFTKCGMVWDEQNRLAPPKGILEPASIRREAEASLRRIGVDCLGLLQFHWPDSATGTPVEDSWETLVRLHEEGKIRWLGVSNFDVPLLSRCEKIRHVDSLQPPFSLIRRRAGQAIIPWCREHGTGVIAYSPMQAGLLTEKWTADRIVTLAQDDWRRNDRNFQPPLVEKSLALRDALTPIARRHGTTVAAVAIAWTLTWPGVTGAIVGARSPEQVDGWIRAGSLSLQENDLNEIVRTLKTTGAGTGPTRPTDKV